MAKPIYGTVTELNPVVTTRHGLVLVRVAMALRFLEAFRMVLTAVVHVAASSSS